MSFWGSLFGGQNKPLDAAIGKFGQIGGFATGLGEKLTSQAGDLDSSLLSGDQAKSTKLLAPQISNIQKAKQQALNTTGQFHNRGGGTNASNQTTGDKARSSVNDMISQLTASALGQAGSLGSNLLQQGTAAFGNQVDASQIQMKNWADSILGMGLTKGAGFLEGFGLGKIPGGPAKA